MMKEETMYVALFCLIAAAVGVIVLLYNKRQLAQSKSSKKRQKGSGKPAVGSTGSDNAKEQQSRQQQQQSKGKTGGKNKLAASVSDKPKYATKAPAFEHPWLASTLKGPASSVLDLDCGLNDKLVTSCSDDSTRARTECKRASTTSKPRRSKKSKPPPNLSPPSPSPPPLPPPALTPPVEIAATPAVRSVNVSSSTPVKAPAVKRPVQVVSPIPAVAIKPDKMLCLPAHQHQAPPANQFVVPTRPVIVPHRSSSSNNNNNKRASNCAKHSGVSTATVKSTTTTKSSHGTLVSQNNLLNVCNISNNSKCKRIPDSAYYQLLRHYLLDAGQQILHGFPIEVYGMPGLVYVPEKQSSGTVNPYSMYGKVPPSQFDEDERAQQCCRCSKNFDSEVLTLSSKPAAPSKKRRGRRTPPVAVTTIPIATTKVSSAPPSDEDKCVYHWGKLHSVNRDVEQVHYTCCYQPENSVGCTVGCHVRRGRVDGYMHGFVKTRPTLYKPLDGNYGVCALDCEMCYTTDGLQVARVTLLRLDGEVLYETMVKTDSPIVDYNTRFSGLTAEDLAGAVRTLHDVQRDLLALLNSDTILIGHGLENDLCALRLLHHTLLDTSALFPHSYGLPYRRSLRSLSSLFLHHDIQNSDTGHDSYEDAKACIDLVMWKLKKDFHLDL